MSKDKTMHESRFYESKTKREATIFEIETHRYGQRLHNHYRKTKEHMTHASTKKQSTR